MKQVFFELIEAGENSSLEFKLDTIRPEQLAKEVAGMANLHGGLILLVVSDAGEVVGLSPENLKTTIPAGSVPETERIRADVSLECVESTSDVLEKSPKEQFQGRLVALFRDNPGILYDELAALTNRNRKTVQRHLQDLKVKGLLRRVGGARGGRWEVVGP